MTTFYTSIVPMRRKASDGPVDVLTYELARAMRLRSGDTDIR